LFIHVSTLQRVCLFMFQLCNVFVYSCFNFATRLFIHVSTLQRVLFIPVSSWPVVSILTINVVLMFD
jgi:hypothetical protein